MDLRISLILALIVMAIGISNSQNIEQKYATRWNIDPIARFSIDKEIEANAVRCHIQGEQYKDAILKGRPIGVINNKTIWQIFEREMAPGNYKVIHDLRTPVGAEWIDGTLRVPQIARHTGLTEVPKTLMKWPQDTHPRTPQDAGPVEFAWDRQNLYIRPTSKPVKITLDLLPNAPNKGAVINITVSQKMAESWEKLAPAGPHIGQVLRYSIIGNDGKKSEEKDLLFVGNGEGIYFGASIVGSGSLDDDQGPPVEIMRALVDMSGLDLRGAGIDWKDAEGSDPGTGESKYDWTDLRSNPDLFSGKCTYVNIGLDCPWAQKIKDTEPERYRKLAQRFIEAAARQYALLGIKQFSLGYNEPEMFFRSDRERYFVADLNLAAEAVRKAVPDAKIIAGKFSSGDEDLIKRFYNNGFKDNFDILDIHPYNNDPRTGTSMGEIVTSHDTLEELGMGNKRIYLGEGWGPTRNLHQVSREHYNDPVSASEANYHREFYQNGYRELITPRMDYSPSWVLGAKYFTLNDNVGGTYWKHRARPIKDSKGEIMYYMIDELRFDRAEDLKASFWNGGLVDFQGRPKGQWFFDFPPSLPEIRVLASGAPKYVLVGEEHELRVTITNADSRPVTELKIGLRSQTGKWKGELVASGVGTLEKESLAPGETWTTAVKVKVTKSQPGPLRLAIETDYMYDGEAYMTDDVVRTEVRQLIDVIPEKAIIQLKTGDPSAKLTISVRNNKRETETLQLDQVNDGRLKTTMTPSSITLSSDGAGETILTIKPLDLEPGIRTLSIFKGSEDGVTVITPLVCPRVMSPLKIDGTMSDWPRAALKSGGVRFGSEIAKSSRPADYPFPEPPPVEGSAIGKGNSTENDQSSSAPKFGADTALMWDEKNLYLSAAVENKTFVQNYTGMEVWRQDSLQVAFDPMDDGSGARTATVRQFEAKTNEEQYGMDDYEYALALTPEGPQVSRIVGPSGTKNGVVKSAKLAVRNENGITYYEAAIPWELLSPLKPKAGSRFRIDILVNNFEGNDRYTLGWANAIAAGKFPSRFIPVILGD